MTTFVHHSVRKGVAALNIAKNDIFCKNFRPKGGCNPPLNPQMILTPLLPCVAQIKFGERPTLGEQRKNDSGCPTPKRFDGGITSVFAASSHF